MPLVLLLLDPWRQNYISSRHLTLKTRCLYQNISVRLLSVRVKFRSKISQKFMNCHSVLYFFYSMVIWVKNPNPNLKMLSSRFGYAIKVKSLLKIWICDLSQILRWEMDQSFSLKFYHRIDKIQNWVTNHEISWYLDLNLTLKECGQLRWNTLKKHKTR